MKNASSYIPHIDGIRTLAVIPVMLYHLYNPIMGGGFTGVDVFFVISGYLIVGGIMNKLATGEFSFVDFYHRRAKRIIPAYFGLIVFTLLVGLIIFPFDRLVLLSETAFASALYLTNVYFPRYATGYFDASAETNPLLNLWSLSVEQQFYILIPLLLVPIAWISVRATKITTIFLCLISLVVSILGVAGYLSLPGIFDLLVSETGSFYMLTTRAWELLAGGILAFAAPTEQRDTTLNKIGAWTGLILVAIPYFVYTPDISFPGITAIPSVLGATLLIRYGFAGCVGRVLEYQPIRYIGKISYSLYLYHWPIFIFWKYYQKDLCCMDYVGMTACSFMMAILSYTLIESPIRKARWLTAKITLSSTAGICCMTAAVGFYIAISKGFRDTLHIEANSIRPAEYPIGEELSNKDILDEYPASIPAETLFLAEPYVSHFDTFKKRSASKLFNIGINGNKPSFLLLGDSHAMHLYAGLNSMAKQEKMTGVYARTSITPLWNQTPENVWSETNHNEMLTWLTKHPEIHTILIAQLWKGRIRKSYTTWDGEIVQDPEFKQQAENLAKTCKFFNELGCRVVLVGPIPTFQEESAKGVREAILRNDNTYQLPELSWKNFSAESETMRAYLNQVCKIANQGKEYPNVFHLEIAPGLFKNGYFEYTTNDKWNYKDTNHLTPEGSERVINFARDTLLPILKGQ